MAFKDCFKEFPVIKTKHLVVGPLNMGDASAMYRQLRQLPENSGWAGSGAAQSEKICRMRINHHAAAFKRKANIHWAVRKTRGKGLIGVFKLFEIEYQAKAEVGYWIGKRYWNNGYATEALLAVVDFGFNSLELHRIYATTDITNVASQRVLQKSGFEREGVLRRDARRSGIWSDSVLFAILNTDSSKVV